MPHRERRLPPLNALKVFDAVARLGSMNKAAAELRIAPSSVTQHIRKLEEVLGARLFERTSNSVALTDAGRSYARQIRSAFDTISTATAAFLTDKDAQPLRLSCVPSLANPWLAAQLATLAERFPGVVVHSDFSPVVVNFDHEDIDLAIRYGAGSYADADSEPLFVDRIAPVCSPETGRRIRCLEDLLSVERLRSIEADREGHSLWRYWGSRYADDEFVRRLDEAAGPAFKSSKFTIEALKISRSVAIVDYISAADDLRAGRLVSPLGGWVGSPYGYHVLTPRRRAPGPAARFLKALLRRNARDLAAPPSGFGPPIGPEGGIDGVGLRRPSPGCEAR